MVNKRTIGTSTDYWIESSEGFDFSRGATDTRSFESSRGSLTIDPARSALVIIDMQNVFLHPSLRSNPEGLRAMEAIRLHAVPAARKAGIKVVWVNWGLTEAEAQSMPPGIAAGFSVPMPPPGIKAFGEAMGIVDGREGGRILMKGEWNVELYGALQNQYEEGLGIGTDVCINKNGISCEYDGPLPPNTTGRALPPPVNTTRDVPMQAEVPGSDNSAAALLSIASSLLLMNERLQRIEARLGPEDPEPRPAPPSPSSHAIPDDLTLDAVLGVGDEGSSLVPTLGRIESSTAEANLQEEMSARQALPADPSDPLVRGLVSVAETELAFGFFVERIEPWFFATDSVRRPLLLRERSPFLFSVILLITNFYNTSKTDRASEVYRGLTECVQLQLGAALLSPNPAELKLEFLLGLVLLLHFKPILHVTSYKRGVFSLHKIIHASKINPHSSLMLHGLMHRTAFLVDLSNSPQVYLRARSSTSPIPVEIVTAFRIWLLYCISDTHGSLQSGHPCKTDATSSLKATRQFAGLNNLSTDARLAATLEGYAIAQTPIDASGTLKLRLASLPRLAESLDRWEARWPAVLNHSQVNGDQLAYTGMTSFYFVTLSIMSTVFTRFLADRRRIREVGGQGRPHLSTSDWESLQRATDAASKMIFSVSVESAQWSPIRAGVWPNASEQGHRDFLSLDPRVVHDYQTGPDNMTCVSFIFAINLLLRLASAGLIGCELQCLRQEYEAGREPDMRGLFVGLKLPRLLLLGSQFLKSIAPQPEHPAFKHGELVETLLETGLRADMPNDPPGPGSSARHSAPGPAPFQGALRMPHGVPKPGSWVDAMSGTSGMSSVTRVNTPRPSSPDGASGTDDAMQAFGGYQQIDPAHLDNMLIDWTTIGKDWEGDLEKA